MIAIGGNVGCSEPLAALIRGLASDTPPLVVSASTISSFIGTFTQSLQSTCRVELQILRLEETPLSIGKVYFATADGHVPIHRSPGGGLSGGWKKAGLALDRSLLPRSFFNRPLIPRRARSAVSF